MLLCGIGAKPVAHLMQYHLLQWEVAKVKQQDHVVCISRRASHGKKYFLRDIHNFSFSAEIQDGHQKW